MRLGVFDMQHAYVTTLCGGDAYLPGVEVLGRSLVASGTREPRLAMVTSKPWMGLTLSGGAKVWWKFFFEAHPEEDTSWRRGLHRLEDWSFDGIVRVLGG